MKAGVIYCLKDTRTDYKDKLKNNILYPFFLVYTSIDGAYMVKPSQSKKALDYFRKLCMGQDGVLADLVAQFDKETKGAKKMSAYTKALKKTISEVVGVQEEIGLDSLASQGGTTLLSKTLSKENTLELISYIVIK